MPIYEYRCTKRHNFEVVQSMMDEPLTECVKCGSLAERVLHAPAVHFKGKGFYNTDYGTRKRNRETAAKKDSSSDSSSSSSDSGKKKSESKPDTPAKPATASGSKAD